MEKVYLGEKYALEYVDDMISDATIASHEIKNARYHHNTRYSDAPSIVKSGILSLSDIKKNGIKNYSQDFLNTMSDIESHVNGDNGISLAVVGLDDLYADEEEYDPFTSNKVDFVISSEVKAGRSSINYGNEFITYNKIPASMFRAIDIRLLKYMRELIKNNKVDYNEIVNNYNYLREIASMMKSNQVDAELREMSSDAVALDTDRLSNFPKLILK